MKSATQDDVYCRRAYSPVEPPAAKPVARLASLLALVLISAPTSWTQTPAAAAARKTAPDAEAEVGVNADSSTIAYSQEFFAQYDATTADEILRRIPGVSAMLDGSGGNSGGNRRGFGSDGDQILIDGRRLVGKSNEISSVLGRIRIQNLERVELLRGTANDIDVRSNGIVVNVILKEGEATTSTGSVELAAQLADDGWNDLDGTLNYNGELGDLGYFVSIGRNTRSGGNGAYTRRQKDERYFRPDGTLLESRTSESARQFEEYSLEANSTYHFHSGDRVQLNALFKPSSFAEPETIEFVEFSNAGVPGVSGIERRSRDIDDRLEWELGGSYEKPLDGGGNVKILSVYNSDDTSEVSARSQFDGDVDQEVSRNPSSVVKTEAILRGSYYWPVTASQALEIGAETARNALEQTIEVFADLDGDGVVERIDIFNPSSKVQENRGEFFLNHNWTMSDEWTASTSLVYETSKISQVGDDINNEANFDFLKPRIDLRYAPTPADQWRVKVEKTVSQLDFSNFVPKYSVRDDRFTEGNPGLRPQSAWEYEFGYEHRLADDQGVVSARFFYNDVQDRIENVAIDPDDDGNFDSATGNIGDATEYGGELTFSIRMASLGVPDLILDGSYEKRHTTVTDPFTGLERAMGSDFHTKGSLGLRHYVSAARLSYGFTWEHDDGPNVRSEFSERRVFYREPEVAAFVEKKFGMRWTLRFDARDVFRAVRMRERLIYEENAQDGAVRRTESFREIRDRTYTLGLTATF